VYREKAITALSEAHPEKNWREFYNKKGATIQAFKVNVDINGQVLTMTPPPSIKKNSKK
jgi:hypothetical protein